MDNSEQENSLRIPWSSLLPLVVVGSFGLGGLEDLADAAVITIREGINAVFSDPRVGSEVMFELVWGGSQLVAASILGNLWKSRLSKIKLK